MTGQEARDRALGFAQQAIRRIEIRTGKTWAELTRPWREAKEQGR